MYMLVKIPLDIIADMHWDIGNADTTLSPCADYYLSEEFPNLSTDRIFFQLPVYEAVDETLILFRL